MNYLLRLALQYPFLYVALKGTQVVIGRNEWWVYFLVTIGLMLLYDSAESLRSK